jgi:hypothetical protein
METEAIGWPEGTAHERTGPSRPVDLVHLSRYTLGVRNLEREVVELFCTQSAIYLERLREAPSDRQWAFGEARGARLRELESSVDDAKAYIRSLH